MNLSGTMVGVILLTAVVFNTDAAPDASLPSSGNSDLDAPLFEGELARERRKNLARNRKIMEEAERSFQAAKKKEIALVQELHRKISAHSQETREAEMGGDDNLHQRGSRWQPIDADR
jgi:hypothetical protein